MPTPSLCFLGIGLMGNPMTSRLATSGFALSAWNRDPAKAEALRPLGVQARADLGEAVEDADIVISMLADGAVVGQVIAAAIPAMKPGALWIDMSSTQQGEAIAFAALLAQHGMRFMDAPVSGGVAGAAAGTLAIMAGGSAHDFEQAEAVLAPLGRPLLVGPVGSGQVAKLCNQLIVGATINIVAEALLLAQAAGADPVAVRAAIRGGFAESRVLELHGQRMLERNFMPGGQVKTQLKDLQNVLVAAADAGLALPLAALVAERYASIVATLPRADHAAALLALEQLNPGQRLGAGPDQLPA